MSAEAAPPPGVTALPPGFGASRAPPADVAAFIASIPSLAKALLDATVDDKIPHLDLGGTLADAGSAEASKFKVSSSKDGLTISVGSSPVSSILIVKASVDVPATPVELLNFISGGSDREYNAMMHEADVMYVDGRILGSYIPGGRGYAFDETGINIPGRLAVALPHFQEYWSGFNLPWPLWARDVLYREVVTRAFRRGDGSVRLMEGAADSAGPGETEFFMTISSSFSREDLPELEATLKYVRMYLGLATYAFCESPASTPENPLCTLTYIVLADAKGSLPDWVQNLVAPDQGQNPGRVRDIFIKRRKAEALLRPVMPPSIQADPVRGIVPKLVTLARGAVHTYTAVVPAGGSLTLWSAVEYKRISVEVATSPAAPVRFTQSNGEAFESGGKIEAGSVLTAVVGPVASATTVTLSLSNAGLHLTSKVAAFAVEYTPAAGGAAEYKAEGK